MNAFLRVNIHDYFRPLLRVSRGKGTVWSVSVGFLVGVPVDALVFFVARRAAPNEGGARTARSGAGHVRGRRATTFG